MYCQFYGLKELPFNVTSDPNFLFMSRHHKEALSHLRYGVQEKRGFIEITGEIGTGKTTLCRALLKEFDRQTKSAFILNPNLSAIQLLQAIVEEFDLGPKARNKFALISQLNQFLIEQLAKGANAVLIIDEAQSLSPNILEQIRLLSNLETEKEKLLQIILVGQPELRIRLASPGLEQLRQRISVRYHIGPLEYPEVRDYIYHRLSIAGKGEEISFKDDAFEAIYIYSKGIPRLINLLCDRILLLGYVQGKKTFNADMVKMGIEEVNGGTCHEHNK